ncbi:MAG: FAD-binding oxidoreductase [Bacteroidota bacterium]|nr:FAD-binding oxidoreductase [Bacteroidota bacterium]
MAKFFNLQVSDITRETADSVSVAFNIPQEAIDSFKFTQGQYLTFKVNVDGQELRRSYSICTSPLTDNEIRIAVKKVVEGRVSTYFNETLKVGDTLPAMPPMGNFYTPLNASNNKHYVLFAGGSGITPMLSILKTTLEAEPKSRITMFYGNQDEASIIFKSQLDKLEENYKERLKIHHILNHPEQEQNKKDPLFMGIMIPEKNKNLLERFINLNEDNEYLICGPSGMMSSVVDSLHILKVDKSRIHLEYFTPPEDTSEVIEKHDANIAENSAFESRVTIICDGEETVVTLGADDVILDAALEANVDAPYACRGGSCCTCRAKLIEGKVVMKVNYALLDHEVEQGYILTCQSMPVTPTVIVNYDQGN